MNLDMNFIHFLVVFAFSFLVGLEVKSYRAHHLHDSRKSFFFFGDVRTFSFIGVLGFVLFVIEVKYHLLYGLGLLAITLLYALLYQQLLKQNQYSIVLFVVMVLVYTFGPIIQMQSLWMTALLFVTIVFILNVDKRADKFAKKVHTEEFETLSKMILLSAVILPLLPDSKIIPYIPLSPFKIWLAVVLISGISYAGYLMQKYFFPSKGYYLTGILGGSYSSTATTVVLARKARELQGDSVIDAAIIAATSVMYLRLLIIAWVFNAEVGKMLFIPFLAFAGVGLFISFFYLKKEQNVHDTLKVSEQNPLELTTAFIFAFIFVVMIALTHFVTQYYGIEGLELLAFIIGLADTDPFILSVLTGHYSITEPYILAAIMIATGSNNLSKAMYALWFGQPKNTYHSALWIALLGIATIAVGMKFIDF